MKIITTSLLCILLLSVSGCKPAPDTTLNTSVGGRISVMRVGIIEDDLAYRDRRGIYIITDNKTGKEFIGVSGIGISEQGNHLENKVMVKDER